MKEESSRTLNFLEQIITDDLDQHKVEGVITRFPPEPNGYLHIGHAKSICLNFGLAESFGGGCNLRFDDTNPSKEETEYVESIKEDVQWLGFSWKELRYASDYFDRFYEWALELIREGLAYVDFQDAEEIRRNRGTLTEPGKDSPHRNRSPQENRELFEKMRRGEFREGECVLRAKIDMAHSNINMRDPILYRILKQSHHRTGDAWCIYPMYDFAHGYEDAMEGVTHSICTLEFEDHRPLYDWLLENVSVPSRPHQYEFARLNLTYTVMSKRLLKALVDRKIVDSWDDPRMPTISGLRRRGYSPAALRRFCREIGVSKANSMVDLEFLHYVLREELNAQAPRVMVVQRPLKVILENYPQDQVEYLEAENNPEDAGAGTRKIPFSRELYIEAEDFMEEPPKKFFRLAPGREVRLKHAYLITCQRVERNESGEITALYCTYDPATRGGDAPDGRRVKGTLHWVSAPHALSGEIRLYDTLFTLRDMSKMEEGKSYEDYLNPESRVILENCRMEPSLRETSPGDRFQFLRLGYFVADYDSSPERLVFNRIVPLKDSWKKVAAQE